MQSAVSAVICFCFCFSGLEFFLKKLKVNFLESSSKLPMSHGSCNVAEAKQGSTWSVSWIELGHYWGLPWDNKRRSVQSEMNILERVSGKACNTSFVLLEILAWSFYWKELLSLSILPKLVSWLECNVNCCTSKISFPNQSLRLVFSHKAISINSLPSETVLYKIRPHS